MSSSEPTPVPHRGHFRFHRSTWLILLLASAALFVIIVPGDCINGLPYRGSYPDWKFRKTIEHGWPWVFLRRQVEPAIPPSGNETVYWPHWIHGWSWSQEGNWGEQPTPLGTEVLGLRPGVLMLDVLAVAGILAALAFLVERRRRRRRLWQFTIGELLVAMSCVGISLGWWESQRKAHNAEETALKSYSIRYERNFHGPLWLRRAVGIALLKPVLRISRLEIESSRSWDEWSSLAASFPYVEHLYISQYNSISNHDGTFSWVRFPPMQRLEDLAEFSRLQSIIVRPHNPTPDQFEPLQRLTQARRMTIGIGYPQESELDLANRPSRPNVAAIVSQLRGLTQLDASDVFGIQNEQVRLLAQLDKLERLHLRTAAIADDGFESLAGLSRLYDLQIVSSKIDGRGLAHLQKLPQLKWLNLEGTQIGDDDLWYLEGIKSLTWLDLDGIKVSQKAVERLRLLMPNCYIEWQ